MKKNCWELKKCGREIANEFGICPASTASEMNSINGGNNGGRVCWAVAGTFCNGEKQGTFAQKRLTCMTCDVFSMIKTEEGPNFHINPQ